jgi:GR25 family glycosyltransferase involved in LPS biosynthesis
METILNAPAFIINLESEDARLLYSTENIKDAGFTDIRRFDAVLGTNENQVKNALQLLNNPEIHHMEPPGKLGCLLSHLTLLKYIIDQNLEKATIFEDDVFFHPQWHHLSREYYNETPSDYDIIFIGNSVDSIRLGIASNNKILTDSCFSAHCYTVTLEGAKRLLNASLKWRYDMFNEMFSGQNIKGLYALDIIYKFTEMMIHMKKIEREFTWYCWNGTVYPCEFNTIPFSRYNIANAGLVFQALDKFETTVNPTPY